MAEADVLYAQIIDEGLRSDAAAAKIEAKARELREAGQLDVARGLIKRAQDGSSFMPHLKKRLREFAAEELKQG